MQLLLRLLRVELPGRPEYKERCVGQLGSGARHFLPYLTLFNPPVHTWPQEQHTDPPHPTALLGSDDAKLYNPLPFAHKAMRCHLALVFVLHLEKGGRGEEAQDQAHRHRGLLEQEGERQDLGQRAA